jgi:tripartite ATP-independent transporter DctP family solute receptor
MKRTAVVCLLAALCFVAFSLAPATAKTYKWRYALEEIEGSLQDMYAKKFKETVEKATNGRVQIDIYTYGQLGTSSQITELLMNGAIDFAFQSPGHLGSYIPEVQIFSIHYLLPDNRPGVAKVLKESSVLYNQLGKTYEAKGLKLISIIPEGWQIWSTNKEIRKPSDFNGFKIRVMTSPLLVEAYKAYGANPTPMPYAEVYSALQLKMIDGQVNPMFAIQEMKFYEHADYLIKAGQLMFICTMAANKNLIESMPEDLRKKVLDSFNTATDWIFDYEEELNTKRKDMILEAKPDLNYIELTDEEKAAFRKKAEPVKAKYIDMVGKSGKSLLEALEKDIKEMTGY